MVGSTDRTVQAIEEYGNQGLIVSICYGPAAHLGIVYSVHVMDAGFTIHEFDEPFAVKNWDDIATVLHTEVPLLKKRIANK